MKKSSKLFSAILAVMLMVSALGAIPANAVEAEVTVNSLPELEEAIAAAVNGDMIYIAKDNRSDDSFLSFSLKAAFLI